MWGFDVEFTTSNYGLTTTPQTEYKISTGLLSCPEKKLLDKDGRRVRVIRPIEELKVLPLSQKARLTNDEILSVVRVLSLPPVRNRFRHISNVLAGAVLWTNV